MAADKAGLTGRPRRIFIIGPSGSGKSTLARQLGDATGVAVHDLDLIYRDGGGNGPPRDPHQRDAELAELADSGAWIVEGIHLDGTQPLMDAADTIVWLDNVSWSRSSVRIVRRFVRGAWTEVRNQHGWRRLFRFGDYRRHLVELLRALPQARSYDRAGQKADVVSRAAVAARLSGYGDKVVRCSTDAELRSVVGRLSRAAARAS